MGIELDNPNVSSSAGNTLIRDTGAKKSRSFERRQSLETKIESRTRTHNHEYKANKLTL